VASESGRGGRKFNQSSSADSDKTDHESVSSSKASVLVSLLAV
jgi:hypothetical protein